MVIRPDTLPNPSAHLPVVPEVRFRQLKETPAEYSAKKVHSA